MRIKVRPLALIAVLLAGASACGQDFFGGPGISEPPGAPVPEQAYVDYGIGGWAEQRYPYDTQQAWVHGYFQEIPAYGGVHFFRPYNYKHVLVQSQLAGGWGGSPRLPYSQQWWHRYEDQAAMLKLPDHDPSGAARDRQPPPQPRYPGAQPPAAPPPAYGPNGAAPYGAPPAITPPAPPYGPPGGGTPDYRNTPTQPMQYQSWGQYDALPTTSASPYSGYPPGYDNSAAYGTAPMNAAEWERQQRLQLLNGGSNWPAYAPAAANPYTSPVR